MTQGSLNANAVSYGAIDAAIARLGRIRSLRGILATLTFPPALETGFEIATAPVRARELRLTLWLGVFLFELTVAADACLMPDLLVRGIALKLLLALFLLVCACCIPAMPSRAREPMLALYAVVDLLALAGIAGQSASVQAPYAMATVSLALIYSNTALALQFKFACLSTAITVLAVALTIHGFGTVDAKLAFALNLQSVCGAMFSLVASYRLERSTRLNYLLSCKERLHIDDLAKEREVLSTLSQTDKLTGLANRVRLEGWSERMFADPSMVGTGIGVLMIDVDYFKRFNDRYGHSAGDDCLRAVADVVANSVRGRLDLAVRFGGEEFIVLLAGATAADSLAVADQVRAAMAGRKVAHADRDDGIDVVTISVGVAHGTIRPGSNLSPLVDAADRALYRAKQQGRNRAEPEWPVFAEAC